MKTAKILLIVFFYTPFAWSQCGGGVPSAGNPGCIPPNQPNSPYYQGDDYYTPAQPRIIWEDRWGAIARTKGMKEVGASFNQKDESEAKKTAILNCQKNDQQRMLYIIHIF